MQKTGVAATRKQALILAAIAEVGQAGSLDVTVSQIAARAGVSSALAHHYFGSKEQIFLAAMRHILSEFGFSARRGVAAADTPQDRINAIIAASFAPNQFEKDVVAAWLAFYVQAQHSPAAERLLRIYAYRLDSNLVFLLRQMVSREAACWIAQGLAAMIDGFYIRCALQDCAPDPAEAKALLADYLDMCLERERSKGSARTRKNGESG
ncbi:MAG: transcriptional regulator BetI [Hyphomicrobiales bacterium]|nr:transcriptional regulator BetI [Hyphomicrobiales bacterium]